MKFAIDNKQYLIGKYNEGYSTIWIAESLNVYPMKVQSALKFLGVELRDKTQAQHSFLSKNKHPRIGTRHSDAQKMNISKGQTEAWAKLSDEEKEKISQTHRETWYNIPEEKRMEISKKGIKAIKETAKTGIKLS